MRILSSALRWAAGGALFTVIFCIVAIGLTRTSPQSLFPRVQRLCRLLLGVMGIRLRIRGLERIDRRRAWLYMGNHQSMFDLFVLPAALPGHAVGIEAAYHFSLPLWGHLTRRWGNIPIHRRDLRRAMGSLDRAARVLRSGTSIVVLPEGHRTLTGQLGEFKKGPFHLARAAGADLLPFVILGLYDFCPKGSFILRPATVTVRFGKPLPYESIRHRPVEETMGRVRSRMEMLGAGGRGGTPPAGPGRKTR